MKDSLIISFIVNIYTTLVRWFENSAYYKIWRSIMNFFGKMYDRSFAGNAFVCKDKKYTENSFFAKTISLVFKAADFVIGRPMRFISRKAQGSLIYGGFKFLLENYIW